MSKKQILIDYDEYLELEAKVKEYNHFISTMTNFENIEDSMSISPYMGKQHTKTIDGSWIPYSVLNRLGWDNESLGQVIIDLSSRKK